MSDATTQADQAMEAPAVDESPAEELKAQILGKPAGRTFRSLPVPLTDAEVEDLIHEAKEEQDSITSKLDRVAGLKERVKLLNAEIAGHQSRVAELVATADARAELRDIECEWFHVYEQNVATLYRLDTEALVDERAMTAEERQRQEALDFGTAASVENVEEFFAEEEGDGEGDECSEVSEEEAAEIAEGLEEFAGVDLSLEHPEPDRVYEERRDAEGEP